MKLKNNNKDLFKYACEQMDKLSKGEMSAETGNAIAGNLRQANNCLRYETDIAKLKMKLHTFNKNNNTNINIRNIENV